MKIIFLLTALLFLLQVTYSQVERNDSLKLLIISEKVGEKIDQNEREHFRILSSIKNFVSATFYQYRDSVYVGHFETKKENGEIITLVQEYPLSALFRMAEKINHYEEIASGRYLSGEDIVNIQVVGGNTLMWDPTLPRGTTLVENRQRRVQPDPDMSPIVQQLEVTDNNEISQHYEFRISYGQGFSKGAPPLHSEDETITYGSTSSREVSNAKDEYFSLGEGNRFEGKLIYYVTEHVGLFFETGYSSSQKEQRQTSTTKYNDYQTTTYNSSTRIALKFNMQSIITGLHFRLSHQQVHAYGGIGIGLWIPSKLTVNYWLDYYGSKMEREEKMDFNTPVGFTGCLGMSIPVYRNLNLFIEGKSALVTYYVQRIETTKYSINGKDELSSLTTHEKITEFSENKNYKESPAYDPNSPDFGGPPYPFIAGSFSVTVGISFGFGEIR